MAKKEVPDNGDLNIVAASGHHLEYIKSRILHYISETNATSAKFIKNPGQPAEMSISFGNAPVVDKTIQVAKRKTSNKIIMKNLHPSINENKLKEYFDLHANATVKGVELAQDHQTAIIEFDHPIGLDMSMISVKIDEYIIDMALYMPYLESDDVLESVKLLGLPASLSKDISAINRQDDSTVTGCSQRPARARDDYHANSDDTDCVSLSKGEKLILLQPKKKDNQEWWYVRRVNADHSKQQMGLVPKCHVILDTSDMKGMRVDFDSRNVVRVYLEDDRACPVITGCTFLPDGRLLVCDKENKKLKLLCRKFKVEDKLDIKAEPWDVSVVSWDKVIVTLPYQKKLQYVQLFPSLRLKDEIQLEKMCWGVEVFNEEIYISCHNEMGDGEVIICNMKGSATRKLDMNSDKCPKITIKQPDYLTVSSTSGNIYISDNTRSITCVSPDGKIIYSYEDPDVKRPAGVYVDTEDNVVVCGEGSDNLEIINAEGEKERIFLAPETGFNDPMGIAYRLSDKTLAVGFRDNNLSIFQLKPA